MKKLLYFLLFCGFFGLIACEDDATNPGDYSLKSTLKVLDISTKSKKTLDMSVLREIDSTYVRYGIRKDTLKDANGVPIKGADGKLTIKNDTTFFPGKITAKFIEMKKIMLDSSVDTVLISLESNSKWLAPMPAAGNQAAWFFGLRLAGGGDGTTMGRVVKNTNTTRKVDAVQYILTSDSTVMYKLVFGQKGEKD